MEETKDTRYLVAKEILDTERTYVINLGICIKVFLKPLQDDYVCAIEKEELRNLFSDIELIYQFNKMLLVQLESRLREWSTDQTLGDVFLQVMEFLKVYSNYIQNYDNSISMMSKLQKREDFSNFLLECKKELGKSSNELSAYLILPVQRVPRYKLLLKELLKNTTHDHKDYTKLLEAESRMGEMAVFLNEKKREAENILKLFEIREKFRGDFELEITPMRRFIQEGIFDDTKTSAKCVLYIFNDIIICGTIRNQNSEKIKFKGAIHPREWVFEGTSDQNGYNLCFKVAPDLVLNAETEEMRTEWLQIGRKIKIEFAEQEIKRATRIKMVGSHPRLLRKSSSATLGDIPVISKSQTLTPIPEASVLLTRLPLLNDAKKIKEELDRMWKGTNIDISSMPKQSASPSLSPHRIGKVTNARRGSAPCLSPSSNSPASQSPPSSPTQINVSLSGSPFTKPKRKKQLSPRRDSAPSRLVLNEEKNRIM